MPLESVPLRLCQVRGLLGDVGRFRVLHLKRRESRFELLDPFLLLNRWKPPVQ